MHARSLPRPLWVDRRTQMPTVICTRSWNLFKGFKKCTVVPDPTWLEVLAGVTDYPVLKTVLIVVLTLVLILETHHQLTKSANAPPGYVMRHPH